MDIVSGILGSIVGPVLGLAGTWLQSRNERESKRIDLENQAKIIASQERLAEIELKKIERSGANELAKTVEEGKTAMVLASMKDQDKEPLIQSAPEGSPVIRGFFAYIDIISRGMRPHITLAFAALLIYLNYLIFNSLGAEKIIGEHSPRIIWSTLTLIETCIIWWFGGRMTQLGKQQNGVA